MINIVTWFDFRFGQNDLWFGCIYVWFETWFETCSYMHCNMAMCCNVIGLLCFLILQFL